MSDEKPLQNVSGLISQLLERTPELRLCASSHGAKVGCFLHRVLMHLPGSFLTILVLWRRGPSRASVLFRPGAVAVPNAVFCSRSFSQGFNWNSLAGQSLQAPWLPDRRKIQEATGCDKHCIFVASLELLNEMLRRQEGWEIPPDAGKPVCPEQGDPDSLLEDPAMDLWWKSAHTNRLKALSSKNQPLER